MKRIDSFSGEYAFLSNFYPSQVRILDTSGGLPLFAPTVEHAFQACKTLDILERLAIVRQPTPGKAKRAGRRVTLRSDWDGLRINVMRSLLRQKFASGSPLVARLLATGDLVLVEGNTWGDCFWGVCGGVGENWLGRLLMERRAELRAELTAAAA